MLTRSATKSRQKLEELTMHDFLNPALQTRHADAVGHTLPRKGPGEEVDEDEEGLELPVNPDQGTPLIPDDEGEVKAPI